MKIVSFGAPNFDKSVFLKSFNGEDVVVFDEKLDEKNIEKAKDAEILCVFVSSRVDKSIIDALPKLRFIVTASTGFDHIDYDYAKTKGVKVSNVPAYGSHTVAEFAFGLILNLSRNIIKANDYLRSSFDFNYNSSMAGFDLYGKTLGVIGTGRIGNNVIKIAKGFGMNVIAYDLHPDMDFAKENNFEYKSFSDVVANSDIITLHTPYNKENHHLINRDNIATMKKGVYLINTARGELVETEALVSGLKNGTIAGFGADVLEAEKQLKNEKTLTELGKLTEEEEKMIALNHELMAMPNVVVTPHIAFYTHEAVEIIIKTSIQNIQGFLSGSPINLVN